MPGVVQHRHQGLGLPVTVEQIDTGPALPGVDDLGVDGLARRHREPQRREVQPRHVLPHEPAELGGGGAEHGDPVALHELEAAARMNGPSWKSTAEPWLQGPK